MKHRTESASSHEFACPHLSDHRTQKAKSQRSGDPAYPFNKLPPKRNDHGRRVPIFIVPLRDVRGDQKTPVIPQIPHFRSNPSARSADSPVRRLSSLRRYFAMSLRRHSADTCLAYKLARKWHVNWHVQIFKNPSKTRKLARKTHSFFSEDPDVGFRTDGARACWLPVKGQLGSGLPASSTRSGFKTWVTEVVQDMGNTCTVFLVRSGACHGRRLK
jgi:hypothetical protein